MHLVPCALCSLPVLVFFGKKWLKTHTPSISLAHSSQGMKLVHSGRLLDKGTLKECGVADEDTVVLYFSRRENARVQSPHLPSRGSIMASLLRASGRGGGGEGGGGRGRGMIPSELFAPGSRRRLVLDSFPDFMASSASGSEGARGGGGGGGGGGSSGSGTRSPSGTDSGSGDDDTGSSQAPSSDVRRERGQGRCLLPG
jgi:hypothetical protein